MVHGRSHCFGIDRGRISFPANFIKEANHFIDGGPALTGAGHEIGGANQFSVLVYNSLNMLLCRIDTIVPGFLELSNLRIRFTVNTFYGFRVNIIVQIARCIEDGRSKFLSGFRGKFVLLDVFVRKFLHLAQTFIDTLIRCAQVDHLFLQDETLFRGGHVDIFLSPAGHAPSVAEHGCPVARGRTYNFCGYAEAHALGEVALVGHGVEIVFTQLIPGVVRHINCIGFRAVKAIPGTFWGYVSYALDISVPFRFVKDGRILHFIVNLMEEVAQPVDDAVVNRLALARRFRIPGKHVHICILPGKAHHQRIDDRVGEDHRGKLVSSLKSVGQVVHDSRDGVHLVGVKAIVISFPQNCMDVVEASRHG